MLLNTFTNNPGMESERRLIKLGGDTEMFRASANSNWMSEYWCNRNWMKFNSTEGKCMCLGTNNKNSSVNTVLG